MIRTFDAKKWHDVLDRAPQNVQDSINNAFNAASKILARDGLRIAGNDCAELVVSALMFGIADTNPDRYHNNTFT